MNTPVRKRVALIGIGDIARKVYLLLLSRHDQAEVVGLLSHSPATVQELSVPTVLPKGQRIWMSCCHGTWMQYLCTVQLQPIMSMLQNVWSTVYRCM